MYLRYGTYTHASNSVALSQVRIRPVRTIRGRRITRRIDWDFMGELIPDASSTTAALVQTDLDTKCNALITAYADDYKDIGFYKDDGSLTSFYLATDSAYNLTGNQVKYLQFPEGDRAEFAGKRTFAAGVFAEFRDVYSQIIDYADTITQQGDGGPIYDWRNGSNGPTVSRLAPSSYVTYIHKGFSVAFDAWPIPPLPMASGVNYLSHLTTIRRTSPRKYSNAYRWGYYRVDWTYVYKFSVTQGLTPYIL